MNEARRTFRFASQGLLAIDPQAFGLEFAAWDSPAAAFQLTPSGATAIVNVVGPLQTRGLGFCDTYGAVRARVAAALASDAKCVVLHVDSPGGDVFGCFDTSRALRSMAKAAGKELIGFTDGQACSAAYALISACGSISASSSSVLGSIGVIASVVDATEQADRAGLRFTVLTSGKRKADGNPLVEITREARAALQSGVDAVAEVFFELVRDHRGIDAEALEAGTRVGAGALDAKLCDRVESFDQLVARIEGGGAMLEKNAPSAIGNNAMNETDTRKALAAAAAAGDSKAMKALKAYDEDEKDAKAESEKEDAEPPKKGGESKKAKASADDDADEKKDEDKKEAKAHAEAILAAANAQARSVKLEADLREALFASRPDLPAEFRAACAKLDTDTIRELLAASPAPAKKAAAASTETLARPPLPPPTSATDRLPASEASDLDRRMGLAAYDAPTNVDDGVVQSFGVKRQKASA